ncbi:unnamed protein product, partial [Ceratitis capitata]
MQQQTANFEQFSSTLLLLQQQQRQQQRGSAVGDGSYSALFCHYSFSLSLSLSAIVASSLNCPPTNWSPTHKTLYVLPCADNFTNIEKRQRLFKLTRHNNVQPQAQVQHTAGCCCCPPYNYMSRSSKGGLE